MVSRTDFPVDADAAQAALNQLRERLPRTNDKMNGALEVLCQSLAKHPGERVAIWRSFLQHEWEPWEEWVETVNVDLASLLFIARSCLRPSLEYIAEDLLRRLPIPKEWLKGYCPVCGSLPALLFLLGEGERMGYCSWCGSQWGLHRLQCPSCDNRYHESLGYIYVEAEPHYRIQFCSLCKIYFKLIDTREMLAPPYFPLEEWTTLHLDLLAQREGWRQPLSLSAAVYGKEGQDTVQSV